ncbi:MAG TPA: FHA domain-containing protein [Actinomycetota bacterium]|nr:FHA domain-containing protein [Actinomycetota bacterium]
MPNLVLELLKYAFLAILYIFVARAVKAIYLELRTPNPRRASARAPAPARPAPRRTKKAPRKLAIVEGENMKGKSFDVSDELVVGRAEKCHIVLDDTYVSQMHARIFSKGEAVMVEDLGSTNGTYLNRRRITSPSELQRGDQVKIGKTVMELRK